MFELTACIQVNTLIQRVDRRRSRQRAMSGDVANPNQHLDRGKVLEILLSAKSDLPRDGCVLRVSTVGKSGVVEVEKPVVLQAVKTIHDNPAPTHIANATGGIVPI